MMRGYYMSNINMVDFEKKAYRFGSQNIIHINVNVMDDQKL